MALKFSTNVICNTVRLWKFVKILILKIQEFLQRAKKLGEQVMSVIGVTEGFT
jgi:hypothetical protein